jgi:hypothetical protein
VIPKGSVGGGSAADGRKHQVAATNCRENFKCLGQ